MHPISLSPIVFQKVMRLLKPNKELKLLEEDVFITKYVIPKILLTYFIDSLSRVKTNAYQFDIDLLREPFKEFAWLFTRVIDYESTTYFPRYVLFVIYGTFRMDLSFNWAPIISNEIAHQLSNY